MMGERRMMQEALFYGFSLERHVPDSHMLRRIDRFVDLSEVRAHLGPYYSDVGRPSIDPELMIRMLIVGRKYHRALAKPRDGVTKDGTMIYFARKHDCDACVLKPKCCPNVPARKIARSVHEAARDKVRAIAKTEAYAVSCRERKKVEMLFAHLKRILRLGRLRLRGPNGAKDEFLLAATAQNLRKLAKLIPLPAPIFAT